MGAESLVVVAWRQSPWWLLLGGRVPGGCCLGAGSLVVVAWRQGPWWVGGLLITYKLTTYKLITDKLITNKLIT